MTLLLQIVVVAVLGAAAMGLGGPLVSFVFRHIDRRERAEGVDRPSILAAGVMLRGGTWIGVLERLAIYAGILAGFGEVIAVTLAVKALARYPELRATSSATAERFIIGTFVSVLFAAGCAGLALWLLSLVAGAT